MVYVVSHQRGGVSSKHTMGLRIQHIILGCESIPFLLQTRPLAGLSGGLADMPHDVCTGDPPFWHATVFMDCAPCIA